MKNDGLNNQIDVKRLALAGVFGALTAVLTIFAFPVSGLGAYIHFGDAVVFGSAYCVGGIYGALAACIGSAISDIIVGASMYIPATLIIKFLMAFFAWKLLEKHTKHYGAEAYAIAGLVMPVGYFLYEILLVSFAAALANLPFNIFQYTAGVVLGTLLTFALSKIKK